MRDQANRFGTPSARSGVPPFIVMDIVSAAARLEQTGARVIHMEIGQPAAPAPSAAIAAAHAGLASGRLHYTESLGMPGLRARIARHYSETYGVAVDPARIIVTTGSSAGFMLAFLALLEPRDRVALAVPAYPPYRHILTAFGCEPAPIEVSAETRWALTPEALLAAHSAAPLKAVVVASPANPTGAMMRPDAFAALIRAAEDAGIAAVSDEIYHGLCYSFPAETAAKVSERAVVINSFSKYFCMTGWRIGWMVVPEPLARPIERLHQNLAISAPTLSQIGAQAAFDGRAEMDRVTQGYRENRRILLDNLPKIGLDKILPVDGAFYLYADVSSLTDDSFEFSKRMLDETGVAVAPGIDFDPTNGHRYVRFCYAASTRDVADAVARIGDWIGRR